MFFFLFFSFASLEHFYRGGVSDQDIPVFKNQILKFAESNQLDLDFLDSRKILIHPNEKSIWNQKSKEIFEEFFGLPLVVFFEEKKPTNKGYVSRDGSEIGVDFRFLQGDFTTFEHERIHLLSMKSVFENGGFGFFEAEEGFRLWKESFSYDRLLAFDEIRALGFSLEKLDFSNFGKCLNGVERFSELKEGFLFLKKRFSDVQKMSSSVEEKEFRLGRRAEILDYRTYIFEGYKAVGSGTGFEVVSEKNKVKAFVFGNFDFEKEIFKTQEMLDRIQSKMKKLGCKEVF